jgi:hypothetical protein
MCAKLVKFGMQVPNVVHQAESSNSSYSSSYSLS